MSRVPERSYSFDDAAPYYDRASRLIGFGTGPWYRRWSLSRAGLRPGMAVLDVGTGTGATARPALKLVGASGSVVGVDPSPGMLARAARAPRLGVVQGLAEALPFRDASFDFLSLGYSLRYVADLGVALAECHRVLRPGGILLALDLTLPRGGLRRRIVRFYLATFVPWMAELAVGGPEARSLMRYCWSTVDRGGPSEPLHGVMRSCGFELQRRTLWFGFLSEHVAAKPGAPHDRS